MLFNLKSITKTRHQNRQVFFWIIDFQKHQKDIKLKPQSIRKLCRFKSWNCESFNCSNLNFESLKILNEFYLFIIPLAVIR